MDVPMMDIDFSMDAAPTAGDLVLCGYKVWSAYKEMGSSVGAVMLQVARLSDLHAEFDIQMRNLAKRDVRALGVRAPSTWVMTWYLPYSATAAC